MIAVALREGHRDGAAHREAEHERPFRHESVQRRLTVGDAEVEAPPRLDPVAHLGEADVWKPRREPLDEPFDGRAPRALDLGAAAAVHAEDDVSS